MEGVRGFCCKKKEDLFTTLFTFHHIALWEYDCISGKINFLNPYFEILGFEKAGILFSDLEGLNSFIHPDDSESFNQVFNQMVAGASARQFRYRFVVSSGETIWLEDRYAACTDAHGRALKIVSYTRNVTRSQRENEKIRTERKKYKALLNAIIPNFIFIFSRDFIYQEIILPEGLRLFHDSYELIGESGSVIFTPEVAALFRKNIEECLDTGELRSIEYHVDLVGKRFYYQTHIVPHEKDRVFAYMQDISDRVRRMNNLITARDRAEEADRMKSAFLANMSHEIRTPLNAIVGFSEIIAESDLPEDEREEYLHIIRTNNELLLKLIGDILDLSWIESGKSEFIYKNVRLDHLLDEVKRMHELKIGPQIEFKVVAPTAEIHLKTDPDRVKQILNNFLSNAIKNTSAGSITLGAEEYGDLCRFFVIDTGRGIPADKLDKIFDRFEKVDHFAQGTGLGLPICQSLVKRLGGELGVDSTWGEGSTFWFTLPYDKLESRLNNEAEEEAIVTPRERKRPLILIAENSKENYSYTREILKEEYDTIYASNGQEAITLFLQETPDLVLMSVRLPIVDGLESARRIWAHATMVPIIGLTSNDFFREQQLAMENGFTDVLARPYSATKLREIVFNFI